MGTNKRYADAIDKRMAAHTDEIIMRDRQPSSLKKEELELDRLPLTRTPIAIPAWAWIHYETIALRLRVEIVAWTPRACAVRWTTPAGREDRAWVWANAVERDERA